jgi:exosortase E/protease (VPEID-CTERM system)
VTRPETTSPAPHRSSARLRWALLGGLLIAEYLLVSLLFDAETLTERADFAWLGYLGIIAPAAVVTAAVTWVVGGKALRAELIKALNAQRGAHWSYLVAHLLSFALLVHQTKQLFGLAGSPSDRLDAVGVVLWSFATISTVVLWVLSALSVDALVALWRGARRSLALGLAAGAGAWLAGLLTMQYLWGPLSRVTLHLVVALLAIWTPTVLVDMDKAIVGTPSFLVEVAPVCSGYEGIGLVTVFLLAYLFVERAQMHLRRAIWLVPMAMLTVYVANALRIAVLITTGARWSPEVALGGLHSKAGWVLVCGICLAFVSLSRRWSWLWRQPVSKDSATRTENPTAAYLSPLLVLIATGMVTGLFTARINLLYGAAPLAGMLTVIRFRAELPRPTWSPCWQAPVIGGLVFLMWWGLEHVMPPETDHPDGLREALGDLGRPVAILWILGRVAGSVLVIPLVEELAFRGYLLRRLIDRDFVAVDLRRFTWVSFLVSSVAFGALHQRWLAGTIAGMAFAGAQYHRGMLGDAVVAHGVANGLIAVAVLVGDEWSMWG